VRRRLTVPSKPDGQEGHRVHRRASANDIVSGDVSSRHVWRLRSEPRPPRLRLRDQARPHQRVVDPLLVTDVRHARVRIAVVDQLRSDATPRHAEPACGGVFSGDR
jgi:hypothetical protein